MANLRLKFDPDPSRENPFYEKSKGSFFTHRYHYKRSAYSGLVKHEDELYLSLPNTRLMRRIALRKPNNEIILYEKEPPIIGRGYHIYYLKDDDAILHKIFKDELNNYTLAIAELTKLEETPALLAENSPTFLRAPDSTNTIHPFDPNKSAPRNFVYRTGGGASSYLMKTPIDKLGWGMKELMEYFPMGYTNLWAMRRLSLYRDQKWTDFGGPTGKKKSKFALLSEYGSLGKFSTFVEVEEFAHNYIDQHEQKGTLHCLLLVAELVEDIYWH